MERHFITYQHSTIHYSRFGTGEEWLFAFHGYGEQGNTFYVLEEYLGKRYTIVAIDCPFHGTTDWNEGLLFTPVMLMQIIKKILPPTVEKFTLAGYSMGGRISLQLIQDYPDYIKEVVLIAPDGLHHNIWHFLSTQTKIGNLLFFMAMRHPGFLFFCMRLGNKAGLFNKSVFNFVHYYLDKKESRLILYKRWTTMRKFMPQLKKIKLIIKNHHLPLQLVFGKYDRVIVAKNGYHFQQEASEYISVQELEAGHQLLKEKYAKEISMLFHC
ncbi:MAG: alpha/beta hydrolase [Bacteroidota bacterium]|nr:alpha/beta hydrolase [Bacteroidota bacterium]